MMPGELALACVSFSKSAKYRLALGLKGIDPEAAVGFEAENSAEFVLAA
jgi:hypothetical protein